MDNKYNIISVGGVVVDFGASPGGWMQIASNKVEDKGVVLGIDLKYIAPISNNTQSLVLDLFENGIDNIIIKHLPHKADVVLSDIAPDIIGVWQVDHLKQIDMVLTVIDLLPYILKPKGNVVIKIFEGEETRNTLIKIRKIFNKVHISKPPASRGKSSELYFVCLRYKNIED